MSKGQMPHSKLNTNNASRYLINFNGINTLEALEQINSISDFSLSYNPDVLQVHQNIIKSYSSTAIDDVLFDLLGNQIELKYRGSYIIIQKSCYIIF